MKNLHKSIVNFCYFTANFPSNFIEKCWGKDHWLFDHLMSKLSSKCDKSGCVTKGAFMNFFMDLDTENQEKLLTWIDDNYLAFEHLKI
jgi:hypothetical protein